MPVPAEPTVTDFEHFVDDEVVGTYRMAHVPCPSQHIGRNVVDAVDSRFDIVFAEYAPGDGGHVSAAVDDDEDISAVIECAEAVRDRVRAENGLDAYEPTETATPMTELAGEQQDEDSRGEDSGTDGADDDLRYIY